MALIKQNACIASNKNLPTLSILNSPRNLLLLLLLLLLLMSSCEFWGNDHLMPIFTVREAGRSKFDLWGKEGGGTFQENQCQYLVLGVRR